MTLTAEELELAKNNYGYGRWGAPYWFIGPEQGQSKTEGSKLEIRARAFENLSSEGLCDCFEFHREIGESRWHTKIPHKDTPPLQSTWRPLILLLMAYLGKPLDQGLLPLREYQRLRWGMRDPEVGETCVIDLSGLPAHNLAIFRDREMFLEDRLARIYRLLLQNQPQFAVIYGRGQRMHWLRLLKNNGVTVSSSTDHLKLGSTTILFTLHPVRSPGNQYWIDRGSLLAS